MKKCIGMRERICVREERECGREKREQEREGASKRERDPKGQDGSVHLCVPSPFLPKTDSGERREDPEYRETARPDALQVSHRTELTHCKFTESE